SPAGNQQPGQQHQSSHHRGRHHRHDNQQQQQQPCPHPQGNPGSTTTGAVSAVASSTVPATAGKNQPLRRERIRWTSDQPLTPSQLRSKREEFWDTAPAFDGRREIWDALRAAACAMEASDHELAQAIISGAGIMLPRGLLTDSYDELGTRYQLPLSNNGRDIRLQVSSEDTVAKAKRRLERHVTSGGGASLGSQRWYCYGRQLTDRMRIKECPIPRGFVIQVVQQQQQQQAAPTGDEPSQATAGKRKESPKLLLF
uniref:Ubiquitin-like domain-containing protein n=1 Tax=Macrostomum lignano TaxID=282301 RepID=A0A1I8HQ58_9PLAT